MSEISTRIWLDEGLWQEVRGRAIAEGITARELIPRLVSQVLSEAPIRAGYLAEVPTAVVAPIEPPVMEAGPPVVTLAEVYRCAVCNTEVKTSGLSAHLGKHIKERQAQQPERS